MHAATEHSQPLPLLRTSEPDDTERFMLEVIARFHGEQPCPYTALAMKRIVNVKGERVIVEAAKFQPARRRARPKWMLIYWNADDVSIRFHPAPSLPAVGAAFLSA